MGSTITLINLPFQEVVRLSSIAYVQRRVCGPTKDSQNTS